MARKRRELRPEERDLWNRVARTAQPLQPRSSPPRAAVTAKSPSASTPPKPGDPPLPRFRIGERAAPPSRGDDLAATIGQQLRDAPVAMDRKAFTRMRRGKLKVDARIDLHGVTLEDAYPRLQRFILNAQARGDRLVLVITGKGRRRADDGPIPERPGVLRRQVPQWLRGSALGAAVLQVSEAHQSHGGSGAYYVYLRRRR